MLYFIERHNDIPFDNSIDSCVINEKIYDIIQSNKDYSLERISNHVINDNELGLVFEKTDPREQKSIEIFIEKQYGPMQELLLG